MNGGSVFIVEGMSQGRLEVATVLFFQPTPVVGGGFGNALGVLLHPELHVVA